MAHSLANTGDKDGVPMSEGVEVEDAADRAERKRNYGTVRVPANKIGFWPGNRGRTGINSIHVHEIARDIMFRKRSRYEPVKLLEVPEALMKPFKAQNKEKCDSDPLMPAFSPDMEYVSVSTTHFSHACKLVIDGTHTLFNQSGLPKIRFNSDDPEGKEITSQGVLAVVYDQSIWEDEEAVIALSSLGNFNAAIDQGEDEMQAFGRINELVNRMNDTEWKDKDDIPVSAILEGVKHSSGFGHFSQDQWEDFIALRKSLTKSHTEVLVMCHFNIDARRIKLKSSNFMEVSKLDKRCPWIKVGLMLYGYQLSLGGRHSHSSDKDSIIDVCNARPETYAKDLSSKTLWELRSEVQLQRSFEKEIKKSLNRYETPDLQASGNNQFKAEAALQNARGKYLAICGRDTLRLVIPLRDAVTENKKSNQTLEPGEREKLIETMKLKDPFATLESQFRDILLKFGVYTESSIPERLTTKNVETLAHSLDAATTKAKDPLNNQEKEVAQPVSKTCMLEGIENALELTQQDVFDRLSISGIGKVVMACVDIDTDRTVSDGTMHVKEESLGDHEPMPDEQPLHIPTWREGILRKLDLPFAHVEVTLVSTVEGETCQRKKRTEIKIFKIHERQLRAYEQKENESPQKLHPSLQAAGVPLTAQNFDQAERDYHACAIMQLITDLVIQTRESSSRVQVFRQSAKDTVALSLHCRTTEAFALKKLVLVPGNSRIELLIGSQEAGNSRMEATWRGSKEKPTIDISMLSKVCGNIQEAVIDQRLHKTKHSTGTDPRSTSFELISPLLQLPRPRDEEINTEAVHPFWAVIKCLSAKSVHALHNMELTKEILVVPHTPLKGLAKNYLRTTVTLPVLRNIVALEKGHVLTLPHDVCFAGFARGICSLI